ncbi:hypothetical protein L227DRAFT_657908 [Lentinus tigrinus ALCF2SS1-6]|uniref:Uncharacterized protein n=1 Tax=Lentinus tigrinus ALCF2SS1-6 TaxID=1328759 RepID=A0A5C2RUY3_9APHY|nr:hypothetical protein L227DRAFT_657908 [Lentinus tigrinus ALCF2SS1-6]
MAKLATKHRILPGISRENHIPFRPRDLALCACCIPHTSADHLVQALFARKGHRSGGGSGRPGDNIKLRLEFYEEVTEGEIEGNFQDPHTFTLMLKVDAPLATHGILNIPLERYVGHERDAPDAPLWMEQVHTSWLRPKRFRCTLGWLRLFVDAVLAPPGAQADPTLAPWVRIQAHLREVVDVLFPVPHAVALGPPPKPRPWHHKDDAQAVGPMAQLIFEMHELHV